MGHDLSPHWSHGKYYCLTRHPSWPVLQEYRYEDGTPVPWKSCKFTDMLRISAIALLVKLLPSECYSTLCVVNQHWLRWWLGDTGRSWISWIYLRQYRGVTIFIYQLSIFINSKSIPFVLNYIFQKCSYCSNIHIRSFFHSEIWIDQFLLTTIFARAYMLYHIYWWLYFFSFLYIHHVFTKYILAFTHIYFLFPRLIRMICDRS